ncbi:MAG: type II toxin-antitoxin system Phd/YefM family antitoxin [Alphaproteobacteria bacterium]|uniref:type II toxin-antitoxin system Phd/YefM family antitoxin n=1 Tax=Bradyrhizobium sp. TaxID=376 RepID=UPI001ED79F20|nr:type II toxin-antitoxin system Phd/YefM family antitoxin [Bradyrhizobium sp.]MBV9570851.1 type II toxin-antitoxin system Phd/YefM family antitoxin [Alphaproteobacteria bacterium]MBV9979101.1 type II toxin-antitoxin system Phd/YefM family antitoxin [Bradyrhizobium sp.]
MAKRERTIRKGAEEARNRLPELLDAAEKGQATLITRHGRAVAALIPADTYHAGSGQKSLLPLAGSGRGLWGRNSTAAIARMRGEWDR